MILIDDSVIRQADRQIRGVNRAIEDAQARAINQTARKARTSASKEIRAQVRLKAGYVNEHLKVKRQATRSRPEAIIAGRDRPTRLARYGAKQLTRKAKTGGTGDRLRRIPAGRKQAGVSVGVKRGGKRSKMRGAFMLPLRNSGVMGVFVRTGPGKKDIKHLYGPSVNQMLKSVFPKILPETADELSRQYERQLSYELSKTARRARR
ncbi:MAG: phage tail protein [Guyparkeria sp.]